MKNQNDDTPYWTIHPDSGCPVHRGIDFSVDPDTGYSVHPDTISDIYFLYTIYSLEILFQNYVLRMYLTLEIKLISCSVASAKIGRMSTI